MVTANVVTQKQMLDTMPASVITTYGVLRNSDSSTSGKRTRRSMATKTTSMSAPPGNVRRVAGAARDAGDPLPVDRPRNRGIARLLHRREAEEQGQERQRHVEDQDPAPAD